MRSSSISRCRTVSKICRSTSSLVRAPTISSKRARAACRSASTNSSGVPRRAAASAAAARRARASRAARCGAVFEIAGSIAERLRARRARARSRAAARRGPQPVVAETSTAERRSIRVGDDRRLDRSGRSHLFATTIADAATGLVEQRSSSAVSGSLLIEHDEHQVRHATRLLAARDAFAFDASLRLARARRVDERHRQPFDVDALRDQIARGARHLGDDRAVGAGQRVEQTRLADVGPPAMTTVAPSRIIRPRAASASSASICATTTSDADGDLAAARRSDSPRPENRATPRAARSDRTARASIAAMRRVSVPSS